MRNQGTFSTLTDTYTTHTHTNTLNNPYSADTTLAHIYANANKKESIEKYRNHSRCNIS